MPGRFRGIHREIHWLAFAGATLLLLLLSRTRRQEMLRTFAILSLGCFLEVLHHLIYRGHMGWRNISDDALAMLVAFVLYRLTGSWKPKSVPRPQ